MIMPYLRAGYPLLWLRTHEPWRTALTLARQLQAEAITPVWHDIVAGGRSLSMARYRGLKFVGWYADESCAGQ